MHYVDILAKFLALFPSFQEKVISWTPNGPKSIKIHLKDRSIIVFLYFSEKNWSVTSQG